MTSDQAKELSHLLLRVGAHLQQSTAFVRDHDTADNFTNYCKVVGKALGDLYLDAMVPLYHRFPELQPDYLGGTYKVPDSVCQPTFYDYETEADDPA